MRFLIDRSNFLMCQKNGFRFHAPLSSHPAETKLSSIHGSLPIYLENRTQDWMKVTPVVMALSTSDIIISDRSSISDLMLGFEVFRIWRKLNI